MLSLLRASLAVTVPLAVMLPQTKRDEPVRRVHISGRAVDDCYDPLFRVAVTLKRAGDASVAATALSNDEGAFALPPVDPGVYDVRLEVAGTRPVVKTIDTSDGADLEMDAIVFALGRVMCPGIPAVRYKRSPIPQSLSEIGLCQILQNPDRYNGRLVSIRGGVLIALEDFELSFSECENRKIDTVWLEYGKGPKRQPTTWCCGDMVPRDPLAVIESDEFRIFHRYLTAQRRTKGHCEGECYLYEVTATLTRRFDVIRTESGNSQKYCRLFAGVGHFGAFCARLVIQSVSDVVVTHKR